MVKKSSENEKSVKEKSSSRVVSGNKVFSVRGAVLKGVVVSAKAPKTVTVERIITKYVPKYQRYKKIRSRIKAHVPDGVSVKEGDFVSIGETRKISKTKSFVVIGKVKGEGQS